MIDSHCHLDDPRFDGERDAVVDRARAVGVTGFVVPGVHPVRWAGLGRLAASVEGVQVGVGVHPFALAAVGPGELGAALRDLPRVAGDLGAVAIGECGLHAGSVPWELQASVLRRHLEVARELELPVILHCVGAWARLLQAVAPFAPLRGVVHGYSGSPELVPRLLGLGLDLGFGTGLLRSGARRILAAARVTPSARALIESDAPDQPLAGDRWAEPSVIPRLGDAFQEITGRSVSAEPLVRLGWSPACSPVSTAPRC